MKKKNKKKNTRKSNTHQTEILNKRDKILPKSCVYLYPCPYCPSKFKWRSDVYRHKSNKDCKVGEDLGYLKWNLVKHLVQNYKKRLKIIEEGKRKGLTTIEYNGEEINCISKFQKMYGEQAEVKKILNKLLLKYFIYKRTMKI